MSTKQHESRKRRRRRSKQKRQAVHNQPPPGFQIKLGGKVYYLTPPKQPEIAEMEQFILRNRRSPLEIAKEKLDGLPLELQKQLLRDALAQESSMRDSISEHDFAVALDTREGAAMMFWLMLRKNHPEVTKDTVMELVDDATDAEFERMLGQRDRMQDAGTV